MSAAEDQKALARKRQAMAYSDFTLNDLRRTFKLTFDEQTDLFAAIPELVIGDLLQTILHEHIPLALAIHTEKARSELILVPVLVEVRRRLQRQISLFSGVDFSVAPERGLNGVCDYILSAAPEQLVVTAPVVMIVEAKNDNIKAGLAQCIAEMIAAQAFNEYEGTGLTTIYGVVSTGSIWKFLKLEGNTVFIDLPEYYLESVDKILAILMHIMENALAQVQQPTATP
jgi:hypothetical protein